MDLPHLASEPAVGSLGVRVPIQAYWGVGCWAVFPHLHTPAEVFQCIGEVALTEITEKYSDLLGPLLLKLPPFHEVSHKIPLIDESKQLKHRLPKCLEALALNSLEKLSDTLLQGGGY